MGRQTANSFVGVRLPAPVGGQRVTPASFPTLRAGELRRRRPSKPLAGQTGVNGDGGVLG